MDNSWKPVVAGILDLITGAFALIGSFGLIVAITIIESPIISGAVPDFVTLILTIITVPLLVIGILAIVGGIFALQKKIWGLALVGSIATTVFWFFVGIPSIVFTVQSRGEFEK